MQRAGPGRAGPRVAMTVPINSNRDAYFQAELIGDYRRRLSVLAMSEHFHVEAKSEGRTLSKDGLI